MFCYAEIYDYDGKLLHREKVDTRFLEATVETLRALASSGSPYCAKLEGGGFVGRSGRPVPSLHWFLPPGFKGRPRTRLGGEEGRVCTVYLAEHNACKMSWLGNGDIISGIFAALEAYPTSVSVLPRSERSKRCVKSIYFNAALATKAAEIGGGSIQGGVRAAMDNVEFWAP